MRLVYLPKISQELFPSSQSEHTAIEAIPNKEKKKTKKKYTTTTTKQQLPPPPPQKKKSNDEIDDVDDDDDDDDDDLQHPERVHPPSGSASARWHADLCEDPDWQNHHFGSGALRHY